MCISLQAWDSAELSVSIQKSECELICIAMLLSSPLSAAGNGWSLSPPALSVTQRTAALAGWRQAVTTTAIYQQAGSAGPPPPLAKTHIPIIPWTPAFLSHLWTVFDLSLCPYHRLVAHPRT